MSKIVAASLFLLASVAVAQATIPVIGPTSAPEIDPAGAVSALTLLAGGLAVVRSRFSKKSK